MRAGAMEHLGKLENFGESLFFTSTFQFSRVQIQVVMFASQASPLSGTTQLVLFMNCRKVPPRILFLLSHITVFV